MCTMRAAPTGHGNPIRGRPHGGSILPDHCALEAEAVKDVLVAADAWLLSPFFLQDGRYTIGGVHYVAGGEARRSRSPDTLSNPRGDFRLQELIQPAYLGRGKKNKGIIPSEDVAPLSLATIRGGGADAVSEQLLGAPEGTGVFVHTAIELSRPRNTGSGTWSIPGNKPLPFVSVMQPDLSLEALRAKSGDRLIIVVVVDDVLVMTSRRLVVSANEAKSLDIGM
ncbi:hypothetical protein F4778DRAFT_787287 [Xylariomycetidae sp. FL2044]|nr:hypothetical protein F4778DRAFT_787287 [Xylariomycetidae sp. FL2044]